MSWLRGLLDRAVLVAGVFAGGLVPGYLAQYRQRVGGALDQAVLDLAPFQAIADRLHGGSLDKLIAHHLASTDATFQAEGAAIRAIADAVASLKATVAALDTDVFHQLAWLIAHPNTEMARATWSAWRPVVDFSTDSLLMAGGVGLTAWALFLAVWWILAALLHGGRAPARPLRQMR